MADDEGSSGERTEEATVSRREEFRNRGQVAQTRELASVLMIFGAALAMWGLGRFLIEQIIETYTALMGDFVYTSVRSGDLMPAMKFAGEHLLLIMAPLLAIIGVLGFAASALQIGFIYNEEALNMDVDRLNPIEGFKKIFSLRAVVEGIKATIKVGLVAAIAIMILKSEIGQAPLLIHLGVEQLMSYLGEITVKLLLGIGVFMAVLAILDYGYLRWELEKKMRMTKQEVKEEHKSREGDPLVKARIRRIQREMANRRMMDAVPKADVVITNPTHIAVCLKYEDGYPAPKLIAKGADLVAEKIKELAKQHGIPIVENKPLARTIFKTLKLNQFVPRELFQAVAEVLAYVYKLRRRVVR
ncbi:MAG TPA: flagellar biosynthesis protein FlhB [Bdellovibrionales bacterium]|nr:flagellar biosynthesis protein FlhB [Bdellovibrionales bacterium]